MGETAKLERLSQRELGALLARLRERKGRDAVDAIERQPRSADATFPLSYAQQRIWFLDQLEPGNPAYNVAGAVRIEGVLRPSLLAASLQEIVRRHEALRTAFLARGGQPVQVILPGVQIELPLVDLTCLLPDERPGMVRRLAREEARRPFALDQGALLRAKLLRLDERQHVLLLTLHHIVADGWSAALLVREVTAFYDALGRGGAAPLPALPVQYADFAVWQRHRLRGELLDRELGFWHDRLEGLPVLELPADRPRPAAQTQRGARQPVVLPPKVAADIGRLGAGGVTPFIALLAACAALLLRTTGQDDLAVGSPVASRSRVELEGLIGFFANTLVLRTDLKGDPTFGELLGRVRDCISEALSHQELPFERLVEALAPRRDLSHSPLIQVLFAFHDAPLTVNFPGLELRLEDVDNGTAKLDLLLNLVQEPGGFSGYFEFSTDLFDAPTIARAAGHFWRLAEAAVADPSRRLSDLPLLAPEERQQLLAEWNDMAAAEPAAATLHALFEAQAERTPHAVAVADRAGVLTYGELLSRARRLAGLLQSEGVGPEVRVGIALERSCELVSAILGVLIAGGGYVPLDPAYPTERLAFMLEDSGAAVLISRAGLRPSLPATAARIVLLDADRAALDAAVEVSSPAVTAPDHLAYVIYTSGSTGRPKGVAIRHGSAARRIAWAARAFAPEEVAAVLASTSVCFDLSVFEIFVPLSLGGRVLLADNALDLAELPGRSEVTLINTVPSALAELVSRGALPSTVRTMNLAGEALPATLVRALEERAPGCRILNLYGPSEDTTYSTWAAASSRDPRPPAIGRPLDGTRACVLDRRLQLVPAGVPGELHLGGLGLARGYLGRPDLTAERFLPDPFDRTGGRLYRTGDLVRWRPDGNLEFLGRIDHQVKLRGFRIELGEIEAALTAYPGVREAVVVVHGAGGEARLVAYFAGEGMATGGELRAALVERLPAYMTPSLFVALAELPRTPNGKVDRKALPAPTAAAGVDAGSAPRGPVEEIVAAAFAELLGVGRVGIRDDFFLLGGHSLLATRMVARLGDAFGTALPVRAVFEAPTVAALAERIALGEGGLVLRPVRPIPRHGDPPLSFGQERLWLLHQLAPESPLYNLPYGLRLRGPLDPAVLRGALAALACRHEPLRTSFALAGDRPVQRIVPEADLGLPLCDLAGLPALAGAAEAERLAVAEARRPFDLERGPLVRGLLLRLACEEHSLILNLHHGIADGWSLGVLLGELGVLVRAAAAGRAAPLPPLPVQYADFSQWQRDWLCGEVLAGQLSWWRERLAGLLPIELPTDRPRPAQRAGRGRSLVVELERGLTQELHELGRREGATLFMVLLAGFQVLLARYAGRQDLAVGSPVADRGRPELEGLIGFFINTLILRVSLEGNPTFRDVLSRAREVTLGAWAHQHIPFEKLVEELQPARDPSRTPFFQALLVLQNALLPEPDLPGLTCEVAEIPNGTAKFDLTLGLRETAGGLAGVLEHDCDLFDRTTAQRLWGHLCHLLAAAVADPAQPLAELPLLGPAERHQLLRDWNDTAADPIQTCLHDLFAAQTARTPDAAALVAGSQVLSYRELGLRAERLARRLHALGLGPEERVGVCMERSPDLVVALLAVLRAGGAYVPLDPDYPRERLALMLEDAGARLLLTQERVRDRLPAAAAAAALCVQGEEPGDGGDLPARIAESGNLAYVIYTSGSTGRPKGVAIEHRSAVALVRWARQVFPPQDLAGVLFSTSVCFDLSVFELFVPLSWGGTVVLAANALSLAEGEGGAPITLINTVPSALSELVELGAVPASVRTINLAGEPLRGALARRIRERTRARRIFNLYGPSEDTTYSTFVRVEESGREPSVGRPVEGTRCYLLDAELHIVPPGTVGELHLAGSGLARGYLGQPVQTAERFIPDPFAPEPGGRLYCTGDLARYRPDGQIEFLGRADHQVKLRGFRIELGEIEAALTAHPAVREAVVGVSRSVAGEPLLVAWIAAGPEAGFLAEGLRSHLRRLLPEFMIPAACVEMRELPRTPNGKVDRSALQEPVALQGTGRTVREPRTPVEELVCQTAAELLGVERIGPDESFFAAGGHSLLAARLAARLRTACGIDLPLRDLFEAPTLAALAGRVDGLLRGGACAAAEPIPPAAGEGPWPLSFPQERLWFLEQLDPGTSAYAMAAAVRLRGALDVAALREALCETVRRHTVLRTRFPDRGGRPEQVVAPPTAVPLPLADLTALPADMSAREADRLAAEEAGRGFDLARGPLLRARLLRLADAEHALLFDVHHIAADGGSMGVLVDELLDLYAAFSAGQPSPLPEPTVQAVDHAAWQRRRAGDGADAGLLARWRATLAEAGEAATLPADRPRPVAPSYRGGRQALLLPAELADEIRRLGRVHGATLFMSLVAAVDILLQRQSGRDDVIVGFPISVRNRPELEKAVGLFLNTLPLRVDLSGDPVFPDLLVRVREASLDAYAGQDLPFERILEVVPDRDLIRNPLFKVLFNLLDLPSLERSQSGLEISLAPPPEVLSKFDLTFYVREERGGTLRLDLVYNADLFGAARIEEMARQLRAVLKQVVEGPERQLSAFSLITAEAASLLPDPVAELSAGWPGSVHARFTEQARLRPEAPAVVDAAGTWTYGQLAVESCRVARLLMDAGVLPGEVVAIHGGRDAALVAALLGVLESGAAFLVLDSAYPALRSIARLRMAAPRAWISLAGTAVPEELVRHLDGMDLRCRLELRLRPGSRSLTRLLDTPALPCGPGTLAYMAFTSGSTGEPKALLGDHGPLSHFVDWHARTFSLDKSDHFSLLSGLAHDPLLRDVFTPLWLGATLYVPDPEDLASPACLAGWMRRQEITVTHLTPALAQVLAAGGDDGGLPSLRRAFFGGAPLTGIDAARLRRLAPGVTCVNFYGATETPQAMSFHVVAPEEIGGAQVIPVGRGIDEVQMLVLSRAGGLCGVGELGEIHIRTPHLTRGYLRDAELTVERFRMNPFTGRAGDRLYRTGDLGRYRPDGEVDFAGRSDRQLQVRGFRVEPAEIETALREHPMVREAVVAAVPDGQGGVRLVAYMVAAGPAPLPPATELRAHLLRRLPEPIVPAVYVPLKRIPLTTNGKVDLRALPGPPAPAAASGSFRTQVEELVAGIFADVLGAERFAPDDDFFELGGHSLLATQVVSRIREALGVDLPVRAVFRAPTPAGLAALAESEAGDAPRPAPILRIPRHLPVPPSSAQLRLWFLHQMDPASAAYNIPLALRAHGPLNPSALAAGLAGVVRRHEVLRTTFAFDAQRGEPVQVIAPAGSFPLPQADLSALPSPAARVEADRLARQEGRRAFDLGRGPVFRGLLVRVEPESHLIALALHHVAGDAWSLGLLAREVAALYAAARAGRPSPLPDLEIQYADFAAWERAWLASDGPQAQIAYWTERLMGAPAALELPTDRPRPTVATLRGSSRAIPLPADLSRAAAGLGRREGATLFMVLVTAFATLLGRATRQEDLVVGTPVARRNRREVEDLVGCFVNAVPLRLSVACDPSFSGLLSRVRRVALEAYAHQELPFERLVEEIQPVRDLGRTPIFQVMCALQNVPLGVLEIPPLRFEPIAFEVAAAKFDLTLSMEEMPSGLVGTWEFSQDLFDEVTILRMAAHFETLLAAAVADASISLSHLELLSAGERHQLLMEWNDSAVAWPRQMLIHELFEEQVRRAPDAMAVTFRGQHLSYGELESRANRLAWWLLARGVGTDRLVAVLMERSLEMIVALLGILKAGGAYVPLEPGTPPQRLRFLLEDVASPVLLTQEALLSEIAEAGGFTGPVLCLDRDPLAEGRADSPGRGDHPDQLAYVNYTSGSTGTPKGVIVPHMGVTRLVCNPTYMPFQPDDRFLQLSTYAWDAATWEIWGALLNGGCLVMIPRETVLDFPALARTLVEERITTLYLTTALFNQVVESAWEGLVGLRTLIVGGETASVPHFRRAVELLPSTRIINEYGPTENTSFSSWELVERVPEMGGLSIGRPLTNSTVYVLDGELEPVSVGVTGELYLGGDGLARGYLGRPAVTAERFVPSPFGCGERLDRSGDLGFWMSNGRLGFLGRTDFQVKIRGHRIEMAEVEEALKRHPDLFDAVVVAFEPTLQDRQLAAYVVPRRQAEGLATAALRDFLAASLPDYMVPAAFVVLESIPLTGTGKADRKALPAPDWQARQASGTPPRTRLEGEVAGLWAELLPGGPFGVEDDFFDLGGHSLLATRLIARVRQVFGVGLELRILFERPTIAGIAAGIEAALDREGIDREAGLARQPLTGELPLSSAQQRLWFVEQLEGATGAYNLSVTLRLTGPLRVAALHGALREVVHRHAALRATFHSRAGEPVQRIAREAKADLPRVDLSALDPAARDAEVRRLARTQAALPFDLEHGPLLRLRLLRLAVDEHVLFLTVHHIAADGWSLGLLTRELSALYSAWAEGEVPSLPEPAAQYPDFVAWERELHAAGGFDEQIAYWKRRLAGELPELRLPVDRSRPQAPIRPRPGAYYPLAFPEPLARDLGVLSRRVGGTLYMTLLAAYATLLHLAAGQEDVLVGSPVGMRPRREFEESIGLYLNTVVLRTDLSGNPTFRELLERVREVCLGAWAHADLPFDRLVDALGVGRDPGRAPLYRVWFVLQNTPAAVPAASGLTLELLPPESGVTKFDLALNLVESDAGLAGRFEYSTDLFEAATIAGLADQLEVILRRVAEAPELRLEALRQGFEEARRRHRQEAGERAKAALHSKLKRVRRGPTAETVKGKGGS